VILTASTLRTSGEGCAQSVEARQTAKRSLAARVRIVNLKYMLLSSTNLLSRFSRFTTGSIQPSLRSAVGGWDSTSWLWSRCHFFGLRAS
jgi:hypothetical protein